jgi:hypothetical protein
MRPTITLLVTTFIGAGAFAAVVTDSVPDGCLVTVEAHDLGSAPTQVDWAASRSRTSSEVLGVRVPDPWHALGTGTSVIPAGGLARRTVVVPGPCGADRQYDIAVAEGDDAWSEPFPGATGWTRATTIHVDHWRATKR